MTKSTLLSIFTCLTAFLGATAFAETPPTDADVIVYEGTPSGVMAAVAAARQGNSVVLIEMNNHVGGMVAGGLVGTDIGDRNTVGGLANDFFNRVAKYYTDTYGAGSDQVKACHGGIKLEPHVAEMIYDQMLAEQHVTVWKKNRFHSATVDASGNVTSVVTDDLAHGGTHTFTGKIFVDASYEGDVMAAAKVPYHVGRESREETGESLAGIGAGPDRGKADNLLMPYNYRVNVTYVTANAVPFPKPAQYDPTEWLKDGVAINKGRITQFSQVVSAGGIKNAWPNGKFDVNGADLPGGNTAYPDGDWPTRDRIAAAHHDHFLSMLWYFQNDPSLPQSFRDDAAKWGLSKDEFTDNGNFPFQLYIREGRRMVGQHVLNQDDVTQKRYKPDGIASGSYGIDCHAVRYLVLNGKRTEDHTPHFGLCGYDIPYGCLTPADKPGQPTNLLVPVCASTTHVAYCTLRMEPVYMMLGHAAGDAAHLALTHHVAVQKVDVSELRDVLRKEGAVLDNNYQPQVKITWTPAQPKVGEPVQFQAETVEVREPLTRIAWDFDGTGKVSAEGEKASNTFALDKVYTVSLYVTDKDNHSHLITVDVPVGAGTARDVTVDEAEADMDEQWTGGYPELRPRVADVYTGPGIHYDREKHGKVSPVSALFHSVIPKAGRYQLCLGFRPQPDYATNTPVTVSTDDGEKKVAVDEQTAGSSPFPFTPIGEFYFAAGQTGTVQVTNNEANGTVAIDGIRLVWLGDK